jgi:O-antigen/teichoic acid export membrane protein
MSQARQIVRNSSIYAAGNILRGLASFVMLPIYTRYLTPHDYGVIELVGVVLDLALLLLGSRVAVGIFKFCSDARSMQERNQVIATALALMFGVHLAAVVAITALNRPIATLLDASPDFGTALAVYSLSAVFGATNEVYFSYLKTLDRAATYVAMNLLKLVLQLALNIFLIAYMDLKYWGVVWSAVASSLAVSVVFSAWLLPSIGLSVSRACAKQLIQFSTPIILASLAMYYIMFSSRYYLQYLDDINAVGIYALANKFGLIIFSMIAAPFMDYWSARQFDIAKTANSDKLFGHVFFYLTLIMLGGALGLLALVKDFVHLSATSLYWPAVPIIPWIAGAYLLQAWGDYFRFGCMFTSKNRYITYTSILTVVVITPLYLYWIPSEGALGAGKAIFCGNFARFCALYYFGQRLFRISVPWGRIVLAIAYFAVALLLIRLIPRDGWSGMAIKGIASAVACGVVFATPLILKQHRASIYSQFFRLAHRQ